MIVVGWYSCRGGVIGSFISVSPGRVASSPHGITHLYGRNKSHPKGCQEITKVGTNHGSPIDARGGGYIQAFFSQRLIGGLTGFVDLFRMRIINNSPS